MGLLNPLARCICLIFCGALVFENLAGCPVDNSFRVEPQTGRSLRQHGWFMENPDGQIYLSGQEVQGRAIVYRRDDPRSFQSISGKLRLGISREDFHHLLDAVPSPFFDFAAVHGAVLEVNGNWSSALINAFSERDANRWIVTLSGGIARRAEMTYDAFAFLICHELGHHFAGFPFNSSTPLGWSAVEGKADYFASNICLKRFFTSDLDEQQKTLQAPGRLDQIQDSQSRSELEMKCGISSGGSTQDYSLCVRLALAVREATHFWAALAGSSLKPEFHQFDSSIVSSTLDGHPSLQCRLDTGFSAALCTADTIRQLELMAIPGVSRQSLVGFDSSDSFLQEREAAFFSCDPNLNDADWVRHFRGKMPAGLDVSGPLGYQPRCWYRPRVLYGPYIF